MTKPLLRKLLKKSLLLMASKPDSLANSLEAGPDGRLRCFWGSEPAIYRDYHDIEWGRPVGDDFALFESLTLESFQSGLSWLTILQKREGFRRLFLAFNFEKIANFDEEDIVRLLGESDIIRHRGKIAATIHNSRQALLLREEFGSLANFFAQYTPPASERPTELNREVLSTLGQTATSRQLSKDLKQRGWKFIGPTTAYAFMQAIGLVNDHLDGCEFC